MAEDHHSYTAATLCARIVDRIGGGQVHVHGAGANDPVIDGREHVTTVLTTQGRQRWFRVTVEEFFPEQESVLSADYDVLTTLARRAGVDRPSFRLGSTI